MALTVEARLRALEGSRVAMIGRINACQTLVVGLWANVIPKLQGDPVKIAETLRSEWLRGAEKPAREFPGIDPATLDVIGQEYRDAIDDLSSQIVDYFRAKAPKDGTGGHESVP